MIKPNSPILYSAKKGQFSLNANFTCLETKEAFENSVKIPTFNLKLISLSLSTLINFSTSSSWFDSILIHLPFSLST